MIAFRTFPALICTSLGKMIGQATSEQLLSHWGLKENERKPSVFLLNRVSACEVCLADLSEG